MRIRLAIAVGVALIGAGLAVALFGREQPFLADNGRAIQTVAGVPIPRGASACQTEATIPAGAGTIRLLVSTGTKPAGPLLVTVVRGGRTLASGTTSGRVLDQPVLVKIGTGGSGVGPVRVCVANRGRQNVAVLGQQVSPRVGAHITDARQPQDRSMRVEWFESDKHTRLSRVGTIAHRYGLMKPGWVGTWTFWVMLVVLLGASVVAVVVAARQAREALHS